MMAMTPYKVGQVISSFRKMDPTGKEVLLKSWKYLKNCIFSCSNHENQAPTH